MQVRRNLGPLSSLYSAENPQHGRGIECEITGIVGIYSDPRHVILYTSNGEVRQEFSIMLTARARGGQPTPSSESSEVRGVPVPAVLRYTVDRSVRIRINDFLARGRPPAVS